jgi:acyl-CoA thioesterase-1
MKRIYASAIVVLALTGCQGEAPVAQASAGASPPAAPAPQGEEVPILALGDSLFAGYGLAPGQSYPDRLQAALRTRGINARIANAGVSGDTTAGGLQRLDFVLNGQARAPALVVISLGGNDMLRGLSPEQTRANLDAILSKLDQRGIPALLMGMLAAPNLGADYRKQFDPIYPALAKKHDAGLVPFFLQPLIDRPELIQADHIHPTSEGIEVMVDFTVDAVVKSLPVTKTAPPAPR